MKVQPLQRRREYARPALAALLVVVLLAVTGCARGDTRPNSSAEGEQASSGGLYTVHWATTEGAVPLNTVHSWMLEVADAQGDPVDDAQLAIDGGMPAHNHGLPTQPTVRKSDASGAYLVEGMKFQMPGEWVITVTVAGPAGTDEVVLPLVLSP